MSKVNLPIGTVVLDAPGITGSGTLSNVRLRAYIEAGGPYLHPIEPNADHVAKVAHAVEATDKSVNDFKARSAQ